MAKTMKAIAVASVLITLLCTVLHMKTGNELSVTLAITFGTISYHFVMRLVVGGVIDLLLNNHVNYHARWFQITKAEQKLYQKIKVKKWKSKMPTYDPSCFDPKEHSWDEIAQAMCQAELVHEVIAILSFIPILAAIPFGTLGVFIITSILSAALDASFVMMQRYNRPRVIKFVLMDKVAKRVDKHSQNGDKDERYD